MPTMPGRDLTREEITAALPSEGLFQGKEWLTSPRPLVLPKKQVKALKKLGHPLAMFLRACDRVYRASAAEKRPRWIADLLNAGKPEWIVEAALKSARAEEIPRVIRPDLLLTADGWKVSEIDSLPGGIGLTAWLSRVYGDAGWDVLGEKNGMLDAFSELVPEGGRVIISDESADYRPEMNWLTRQLGSRTVERAEEAGENGAATYRFFELFDWQNIPAAKELAASDKVTPVMKHHLEEKLWLALFKTPSLKTVWQEELRGSHLKILNSVVPQGWVIDSTPLPPHASIPHLNVSSWNDVADFSQKEREIVVKVSGFSEEAWGSRGVYMGHDLSGEEWKNVLTRAQDETSSQPWIAQEFQHGEVIEHPYYDSEGRERIMEGRVRVCPYFFVTDEGRTELAGCLATIVPKDKKKIHGMRDGILVPCVAEA